MTHPLAGALALVAGSPLNPMPLSALPADLQPLVRELGRHGFSVKLAVPPVRGVYGLYQARQRTIWVAPISFELGIARPTFLHEAVHAVQSCPTGVVAPLGWQLPLAPVVRQQIGGILATAYHGNKAAEQEAFALQSQPDAVPRLLAALRQRCAGRAR
ncbi:hypothetical protein [Synechococcus sp. CCY 9618]|uniref:hypothetical protein n=1 Tax=Synechococcus sp. CCY 9618 TaxID=2815602 RepID=UPI001C23BB12|nr:hypothetical protein [Synechococcus sp. CCY 9618]